MVLRRNELKVYGFFPRKHCCFTHNSERLFRYLGLNYKDCESDAQELRLDCRNTFVGLAIIVDSILL